MFLLSVSYPSLFFLRLFFFVSFSSLGCYKTPTGLYSNSAPTTSDCSTDYPCICVSAPTCNYTDGTTPNTAACLCGGSGSGSGRPTACTATTTNGTGLICEVFASEASLCSGKSLATVQADTCTSETKSVGAMPNCRTFTPRCQCSQCKSGFYSDDCSMLCPVPGKFSQRTHP